MATEIKVPEMGESVTEGTIARWFKAVGEAIKADEPLVEIETDKVTVEVPAPSSGVLTEIRADEGADVEVGSVIGAIDESATASAASGPSTTKSAPAKEPPAPSAASPAVVAASGDTIDITIPELGESVTEGTVGRWLKQVGESFEADEALVEIETDKVTAELPAPSAGTLVEIISGEGVDVEVGAVVGRISAGASAQAQVSASPTPAPTAEPAAAPQETGGAANTYLPLAPAVRKLVDENGLNPADITATGRDGRITKGDVLQHFEGDGKAKAPAVAPSAPATSARGFVSTAELPDREEDPRGEERVRMTKLRQTVATRLKEAQNTAAMLTTFNEIDMQAIMDLRTRYKGEFEKKHGTKLGFMSIFVKAAINALKEIPAVNAEIYGDQIIYKNYYDIGIAVGGSQGLVVPVMRDADQKSFPEIESGISELGQRARDGKLTMSDLTGGTFTITNGGIFGSMLSTPILNPPQSGILGMHNIVKRPMVVDDEIVIRPIMYVALSYDHRIVDGREAVTFLVRIKQAIEDPERLLIGV
ncbi:MAG: 2-oxoglutarate dehydrogenase complex dihydrolipoyllysine-residue succinyltransferase [Alphaproteobacteria bacterium]|nr:2-oxoglutarate dehydrogenase complex dihydrolipoyllysine-residue succinyltransferase [Alphaproteobacteria bacterium]